MSRITTGIKADPVRGGLNEILGDIYYSEGNYWKAMKEYGRAATFALDTNQGQDEYKRLKHLETQCFLMIDDLDGE